MLTSVSDAKSKHKDGCVLLNMVIVKLQGPLQIRLDTGLACWGKRMGDGNEWPNLHSHLGEYFSPGQSECLVSGLMSRE